MSEKLSAHDQANDYVNDVEVAYALTLLAELNYWAQKAEGCGCPACKKREQTYKNLLADEYDRLDEDPNKTRKIVRIYEPQLGDS